MAVTYEQTTRTIYYQTSTTNSSFLAMSQYLQDIGIDNYRWMLILYDPDLAGIDPYDNNLPRSLKVKVLREIIYNPIYFFREVLRVPDSGQTNGVKFELNRGNMALLFCLMLNMNIFLDLPRQTGKTIGALGWYLYLFNFGTANAEMSFLNKKLDDSKLNLQRLREMRELLPAYLRMDQIYRPDGSKAKARNSVETLQHPINANRIRTVASARNKVAAASLMRGRTTPIIYMDEYAFTPYNKIIYTNMVPAFNTAAQNAKRNRSPYGMVITTTPGDLTTDEGIEAFNLKELATPFSERWYNLSPAEIYDIINSNTNNNFVYIRFTYQQLGKSEEWFKQLCIAMQKDWPSIRREVLLEWSVSSENSPFAKEDLDTIRVMLKQPIRTVLMLNKFTFNIYEEINLKYPPIIGCDVSGGYNRDSSAITIVDSYSTKVTADFNCNFISTLELARLIYELVTKFMPNAVVNVERNGGFGASVLSKLLTTSIKHNLFYTIKDKIVEERIMGAQIHRKTQKTKIYGSDSTKAERENLMEILRDRVSYHKDKIISPIIYEELCGLEVKKNGRIEHSNNTHDDQVFSWLWALYVYYNGGELMNNWGITKRVLRTDADFEEAVYDINEKDKVFVEHIQLQNDDEIDKTLEEFTNAAGKMTYEQWMQAEAVKDKLAMDEIMMTKVGREAIKRAYPAQADEIDSATVTTIPNHVFDDFYNDDGMDSLRVKVDNGNLNQYL